MHGKKAREDSAAAWIHRLSPRDREEGWKEEGSQGLVSAKPRRAIRDRKAGGGEAVGKERREEGHEMIRRVLAVAAALAIWVTGAYPPWKMSVISAAHPQAVSVAAGNDWLIQAKSYPGLDSFGNYIREYKDFS